MANDFPTHRAPDADNPDKTALTHMRRPGTSPPPSTPQRWLMYAVLVSSAFVSLLFAVLFFFSAALVGTVFAAVGLRHTDAFHPSTFGGGFWLALVLGVLITSVGLYLRFRWSGDDSKLTFRALVQPSVALLLAFVTPAILLTFLAVLGFEIPKILAATVLLGTVGYLWLILPFVTFRLSWRLFLIILDWGKKQAHRANLVVLGSPLALLVCSTYIFGADVLGMTPEESYYGAPITKLERELAGLPDDGRPGITDISFNVMSSVEARVSRGGSEPPSTAEDDVFVSQLSTSERNETLFRECIEELMGRNARDADISPFEQNRRRLLFSLSDDDAHDLATQKLIDVCDTHSRAATPYRELAPVYTTAVTRARDSDYQQRRRRREIEEEQNLFDPGHSNTYTSPERIMLRECIGRLPENHRKVLVLSGFSSNSQHLASQLEISPAAARQRLSRARRSLEAECGSLIGLR